MKRLLMITAGLILSCATSMAQEVEGISNPDLESRNSKCMPDNSVKLAPDESRLGNCYIQAGEKSKTQVKSGIKAYPPCTNLVVDWNACSPVPYETGGIVYFDVCQDDIIHFEASATCNECSGPVDYSWKINSYDGNGPIEYTADIHDFLVESGTGYDGVLEITGNNCASEIPFRIRSSSGPLIQSVSAEISGCIGNATEIVAGGPGSDIEMSAFFGETSASLGIGELTFIPDGPNCDEQCYESSVTFTDFPINAEITSAEDVKYLRINMEHSFIGDIQISLVGPEGCGEVIILQDYYTESQGGLDNMTYEWPHMNSGYVRVGFGAPNTEDIFDPSDPCDDEDEVNLPGEGWDYCWSNNAEYSYANGNAWVYEAENMSEYETTPLYRVNPSDVAGHSNFYHPYQGFEQLEGCPLNGEWTIRVCDSWRIDNGWIFEWEMALDADLLPENWSYQPEIDHIDWDMGTDAAVDYLGGTDPMVYNLTPETNLADGENSYSGNFTIYDEFGCSNTATIDFNVSSIPVISGMADDDFVWTGYHSNDWDNATCANWLMRSGSGYSNPVIPPTETDNVYIVTYCDDSNQPEILEDVACNNLSIHPSCTLTIKTNNWLDVKGDFSNSGSFVANQSEVYFNGSTEQIISTNGDSFYNLTINNSGPGINLLDDLDVNNKLWMDEGDINSNGHLLTIGTSELNPGLLEHTDGAVFGPVKRWFSASACSGNETGLFPIGFASENTDYLPALLEYPTPPEHGGSITAEFINEDMGDLISPVIVPETDDCSLFSVQTLWGLGYWSFTTGDGFSGGTYDITFQPNGITQINDFCGLTALKRSVDAWETHGTHVKPSGTIPEPVIKRSGITSGFSDWGIGGSGNNALPVNLTAFDAECLYTQISVSWVTASELNNDYFTLERSNDGIVFYPVAFVDGNGTTKQTQEYSCVDAEPVNGRSYYRLKQTDYDGSTHFSDVITCTCYCEGGNDYHFVPNPFVNEIHIDFMAACDTDRKLYLEDLSGRMLLVRKIPAGVCQYTLTGLESIHRGTYILTIQNGGHSISKRIIKQ